jgi:hypothetical protein
VKKELLCSYDISTLKLNDFKIRCGKGETLTRVVLVWLAVLFLRNPHLEVSLVLDKSQILAIGLELGVKVVNRLVYHCFEGRVAHNLALYHNKLLEAG